MNVKPLNADTTFLIDFIPSFAPPYATARFPGSFTILIDPWVTGSSSVWSEAFQISHHTTSPCISSLRDIPEPDLIIISQDKPDHCHKQTIMHTSSRLENTHPGNSGGCETDQIMEILHTCDYRNDAAV
jgi:hypothetical protein